MDKMTLKQDMLKDIEYLKTQGRICKYTEADIYSALLGGSKYDYKTRQVIKDIISILDIKPAYITLIEPDILKYFSDYNLNIYKGDD